MPSWTLESLEAEYPQVNWREPAVISVIGDPRRHYACKVCIAEKSIKARDIPSLPTEPGPITEHLRIMHRA